jgi:hypothetical protein
VDEHELAGGIRFDGMAVDFRRGSVGSPSGMSDGDLRYKGLLFVDGRCGNLLAKSNDFPDLFEEEEFVSLIAIDDESS